MFMSNLVINVCVHTMVVTKLKDGKLNSWNILTGMYVPFFKMEFYLDFVRDSLVLL